MGQGSCLCIPSFGKICRDKFYGPHSCCCRSIPTLSPQPNNRKDGSKATTLIKRVSGDRDMFLSELRTVLDLPQPYNPKDDQLRARAGGNTVEIDGNRVREVKQWLAGLGF